MKEEDIDCMEYCVGLKPEMGRLSNLTTLMPKLEQDDTLIFCDVEEDQLKNVKAILLCFEAVQV